MNIHSIKFRITAILVFTLSIVLLMERVYLKPVISQRNMSEARLRQTEIARQVASSLDFVLWQATEELEAFARLPDIESMQPERLDRSISEMNSLTRSFSYYYVLDSQGNWVSYPNRPELVGKMIKPRNFGWVEETLRASRTVALDLISSDSGELETGFSTPIQPTGQQPTGVLRGVIVASKPNYILSTIKNMTFGQRGYPYVVSKNGWLIAHAGLDSEPEDYGQYDYSGFAPVEELMKGLAGVGEYKYQGDTWLAAYQPIKTTGWGVVVQQPKADIEAVADNQVELITAVSVVAFVILALSLGLIINLGLRPLTLLIADIRSRRLPVERTYSKDEIGQLTREFHSLYEALARSEEELRKTNEELEERIKDRTVELEHSNEQLKQEIMERKRMEEHIKASLGEKEVLLKEIHHRVKNNLQVISSLLSLQSGYIEDKQTLGLLKESQDRVRSMALIHESLYQSGDLARVDFKNYVETLSAHLLRSYSTAASLVALDVKVPAVHLDIDAVIPCGLIVNELVSNCLKYAFPGGRRGTIKIRFEQGDGSYTLSVSDDGVGLPPDLDVRETRSLGMRLVKTLTEQLEGRVDVRSSGEGTSFTITFNGKD